MTKHPPHFQEATSIIRSLPVLLSAIIIPSVSGHRWTRNRKWIIWFQVSLNSSLPSLLTKPKSLWSFGLSSSCFSNQDIPLNFVHSCTTQANLEVSLLKHLYPGLQREEGAPRWKRDWKKSSASNLSLCFLRTHRRTGTRRARWRSSVERQIQTQCSVTSWTVAAHMCRSWRDFVFPIWLGESQSCTFPVASPLCPLLPTITADLDPVVYNA